MDSRDAGVISSSNSVHLRISSISTSSSSSVNPSLLLFFFSSLFCLNILHIEFLQCICGNNKQIRRVYEKLVILDDRRAEFVESRQIFESL